ncbi:MAG: GNAT family N-acetyltransferase [Pseudomonadota bacterium]
MKLVRAGADDFEALAALFTAAFADYIQAMGNVAGPKDWLRAALDRGDAYWLDAPERVGAVALDRDGSTLVLDELAIDPDHQRGGNGRAALAAIEDHARAEGFQAIRLFTGQQFTHLVAFYSSAGFRVISIGAHPQGHDDRLRVTLVKPLR